MNGAQIQAKINAGLAKAAARIGYPVGQYRPVSATVSPIIPGNLLQTLPVSFNAQDMTYSKPSGYNKPVWYAVGDRSNWLVGDYLANVQDGTFFIVAMQTLLPTLIVQCNATLSIYRPATTTGQIGIGAYGGETLGTDTQLVNAFPCSILQGSKGDKSIVALPGDVRTPWWAVLLPLIPGGIVFKNDDVAFDQNGKRYKLSSCENTDMGWRLSATEAET